MSKETVKVTVTVEMSKKAKELLEDFARHVNTTAEEILKEQIMAAVSNFYEGGFYEAWTTKLEGLAREIQQQFDC